MGAAEVVSPKKAKISQVRTALDEKSTNGAFVRRDAAWRDHVSSAPDAKFPAEADRYHLFLAYACPWAHR
jgi:glutathionyl-hydroquinone reductase